MATTAVETPKATVRRELNPAWARFKAASSVLNPSFVMSSRTINRLSLAFPRLFKGASFLFVAGVQRVVGVG